MVKDQEKISQLTDALDALLIDKHINVQKLAALKQ